MNVTSSTPGRNVLSFKLSGSEKMRIASDGSVGIGTTAPATTLDVSGTTTLKGTTNLSNNNIINIGNVGIGTAAPSYKLDVIGSGSDNIVSRLQSSASYTATTYVNTGASNLDVGTGSGGHFVYGYGSYPLYFGVNGSEKMRITSAGNVGIGTSSPSQILQVGNGGRLRISNDITDYSLIGTKETDDASNTRIVVSGYNRTGNNGDIHYVSTSTGAHKFITGNSATERMRIDQSGNVGIGTTTPGYTLDVSGTINSTNISRIIASGSGTSASSFEITGLDFSNFMMNEIIISCVHNGNGNSTNSSIRMEVSYNGTSYYDTGSGEGYEITSTVVSPSAGSTAIQQGITYVGQYINITSATPFGCTALCKLTWCGNMGARAPVYWFSVFTRADQGCAYMHGALQSTANTGNPVKLRIAPSSGSFNAYKWRVIGNI